MTSNLANKNIVLGVTGSIAAYKAAELTRRLREAGANVRVVMTKGAAKFITPLTMQAVSGNPVHDDLFDREAEAAMGHIELARWADLILVGPATADCMARLASGRADDLLTTIVLASQAKVAIAPAMNQAMWLHPQTQQNKEILIKNNIKIIGPDSGEQACGDVGPGRLLDPEQIVIDTSALFATGALVGKKMIVTAGPTQEAIDPVRYITNHSTGKMGYALAQAAHEAGAQVVLISGPVTLLPLKGIEQISVTTANEMFEAVMRNSHDCDIFLSAAAVGDYRPKVYFQQKLKKQPGDMALALTRNPDITKAVGELVNKPFIVGFAGETENLLERAQQKRMNKKMDMIIANNIKQAMGSDKNEVIVITETKQETLPMTAKSQLARQLINLIAKEVNHHDRKSSDASQAISESHD